MAAELGQTTDPKQLVPGSPEAIERHADSLARYGERSVSVGDGLSKVDVLSWMGPAADGFHARFSQEPPKWRNAGDALGSTSSTLTGYADTLRWAQSQAREAIALWERGEQATTKAKADHAKAVAAAAGGGGAPVGAYVDPGEEFRQQARELLDRARQQLSDAGNGAAGTINGLLDKVTPKNSSGDMKGEFGSAGHGKVDPKLAIDGNGTGGNLYGSKNGDGDPKKWGAPGDWSAGGGYKAWANLLEGELTGKTSIAGADFSGKATGTVLGAQASGTAAIVHDADGPRGKLGVQAIGTIVGGTAEGKVEKGIFGATAKGNGFVGAQADAQLQGGTNGLYGQAGAFAGAKAGGSVGADVAGIGAGVGAEGWAGAGAEAEFTLGKNDDGKWTIGGNVGAGLGLGGKIGGEITVDTSKLTKTVGGLFD